LAIRWSRQLPKGAEPSTVTVKLDPAGRWFVSLLVDDPTIEPLPPTDKTVGLDAGLTSLITTSDGEKVVNPRHLGRRLKRLRLLQKSLSRKVKGSNNRYRARLKVARLQARIADSRRDHLHKLTTRLVQENQLIAVETLAVRNMVKNRSLARSISDCGWGELVRQLEYKCDWYGRTLVKIDQWFPSSKRCGDCGHIVERLPLSVREWACPQCGAKHDRDINAAQNILAAGLAVKASGAGVRPDRHSLEGSCNEGRNSRK
jgi:putative transposase